MALRICMLIYSYWPGPEGGTERQCRKLSTALSRRGVECTVLTTRASRGVPWSEEDNGVRVVRMPTWDMLYRQTYMESFSISPLQPLLPEGLAPELLAKVSSWLNSLLYQIAATGYLMRHGGELDLLHVHTSEWIAGFAVWIGRRLRKPILCKVATLPVLPTMIQPVPFKSVWERLRRKADFIALNESMAIELRANGVPDRCIRVIPNSVDLPPLGERNENENLVLYVGNLTQSEWKAFDVLFGAWETVHRALPDARLAVLGGGDYGSWERYLEERECRGSVSFEGFVRDVDAFYQHAALLVLPSRQEGMSNALLEAQSWGIPAVVSDIKGNRAVVHRGVNGIVVPVNDVQAFAGGIIRLLQDSSLRSNMGKAARERVENMYDIKKVTDQTVAIYKKLVRFSQPKQ